MPFDSTYTDYEVNYNDALRVKSEKEYKEALEARKAEQTEKAEKTGGVLQTGNTGPGGVQAESAVERNFESVAAYLEFLKLEFADSIFTVGEFSGNASELSGFGSILLSPGLLRKMVDDSVFRKSMEKSIADISEAEKNLDIWYKSNNSNVLGHGAVIDADGNAKAWSFVLEDLNSMEKLGSTSAFMKMEELREKAMKLDV